MPYGVEDEFASVEPSFFSGASRSAWEVVTTWPDRVLADRIAGLRARSDLNDEQRCLLAFLEDAAEARRATT